MTKKRRLADMFSLRGPAEDALEARAAVEPPLDPEDPTTVEEPPSPDVLPEPDAEVTPAPVVEPEPPAELKDQACATAGCGGERKLQDPGGITVAITERSTCGFCGATEGPGVRCQGNCRALRCARCTNK